jgi:hypothetical protein
VFKKKDTKPRSWEEYCNQQQEANSKGHYNSVDCDIYEVSWNVPIIESSKWRNVLPSEELTEAFLAMMQLMSLRQSWIGDWNSNLLGYAIILGVTRDIMISYNIDRRALTFPDKKMAVDFMNCFKDLLEIAKPLI